MKAAKIFTLAKDVDYNGAASHKQMRDAIADAPEKKAAHALLKRQPALDSGQRDDDEIASAYELMKFGRKSASLLETYLADSQQFGPLLFAPSGGVRDTRTGLYAELKKLPGTGETVEYVLCFPGTGCAGAKDSQWKTNVRQLSGIGGVPKLYQQAQALAGELKKVLQESGATLSVAGHSLGGGIANFVGLALDLDSYCFNAAALGPASIGHLEVKGCLTTERIARQVHVGLSNDWAIHPTLMAGAKALSKLANNANHGQPATQVGQMYLLSPDDPHYPAKMNMFARHDLSGIGGALYQHTRNPRPPASSTSSTPVTNAAPTSTQAATPLRPGSSGSSENIQGDTE